LLPLDAIVIPDKRAPQLRAPLERSLIPVPYYGETGHL
jgi:hypothetical protein